jgi:hypothetical protein
LFRHRAAKKSKHTQLDLSQQIAITMDTHEYFPFFVETRCTNIVDEEGQSLASENVEQLVHPTDTVLLKLHNKFGLPVAVREERIDDTTWTKKIKVIFILHQPSIRDPHADRTVNLMEDASMAL